MRWSNVAVELGRVMEVVDAMDEQKRTESSAVAWTLVALALLTFMRWITP